MNPNQDYPHILKEISNTIVNGRTNFANSAKNPLARKEITYYNPKTDKMQTQNYLEMEDLVIPIIIKRNEQDEIFFGMQYEYIPATKKVHLELPDCPFFDIKKSQYSIDDVADCLDKRFLSLGLEMQGFKYLDSASTAVSPSFTDQTAKIALVSVTNENGNNIQWFPITSLKNCIDTIGSNSSLQTQYALELLYTTYKNDIEKKGQSPFIYDKKILGNNIDEWKDTHNIMEHKYRFGIELAENSNSHSLDKVPDLGQVGEYGMSKHSAQCLVVKKVGNKFLVGLSKQQRSPLISRDGIDENVYEMSAGMLEENETYIEAARRETAEEQGIKGGSLFHVAGPFIESKATQEYTDFYICEITNETVGSQHLDEQEYIEEVEWFDLNDIDLNTFNASMPTKFMILKARDHYSKEIFKSQDASKIDDDYCL